jgi:multimeric flavodoxin WrbA
MKFSILSGSPKGAQSVTMQYILYIQKKHPEHEYNIFNVAQIIKRLEKDQDRFDEIIEAIKESDGVIWAFPVYVMLVCSQYKRFIELIFERKREDVFKDKYTMVLSTSIHFYDHTAQNYIHAICDDLGMKYVGNFPADSWDLLYPKRRARWLLFSERFFEAIEMKHPTTKNYHPLQFRDFVYQPGEITQKKLDTKNKTILVLSEDTDDSTNLGKMVNQFVKSISNGIELININDIDIKGPCIGCAKCGYNHECIYKDKDGFTEFWTEKVMKTDILIFAGTIKDRYLSSRWKLIYDRAFFNNHTPTIIGKQLGYIISGPISQIPNLKEMLQAHVEYQDSNFLNSITDEFGESEDIDALLYNFAKQAIDLSVTNYIGPRTFLGEAAMKMFRDDVYGRNRFVFLADHEYYKTHGVYDTFPQNDERAKKLNEKLIPLMKIDKLRNNINMMDEFLRPFRKVLSDPNK